jgi:hypothetical protein
MNTLDSSVTTYEIADGSDTKRDCRTLNGVSINTVPDALASAALGEYLQQYSDDTGAPAFFTDGVFDANKYSAASDVLWKGVLFNPNKGSEAAGTRTGQSRQDEPYWDFVGGALQLSRMVPDPDVGVVIRVAMSIESRQRHQVDNEAGWTRLWRA